MYYYIYKQSWKHFVLMYYDIYKQSLKVSIEVMVSQLGVVFMLVGFHGQSVECCLHVGWFSGARHLTERQLIEYDIS